MCKFINSLTKLKYCNDFLCTENALKLTYSYQYFQKFSGGYTPGPPLYKGRGSRERGRKGREGKKSKDRRDPSAIGFHFNFNFLRSCVFQNY
jgi:hypothetical protein